MVVQMFKEPLTQANGQTAADSAVVRVVGDGGVTLLVEGESLDFGGATLAVECSVGGGSWQPMSSADGEEVSLTEQKLFPFDVDLLQLRVAPSSVSGSTNVPAVYLAGDIAVVRAASA